MERSDPRQRIVTVARDVIEGRCSIIEGSRILAGLRYALSEERSDPDFMIFRVVDSDTDHLPLGEVRKQWAPGALEMKDQEIAEVEAFYREAVLESCERLLERFARVV